MPSKTSPKLLLGTGNIGDSKTDPLVRFDTSEEVETLLESFYQRGHRQIDTAQAYSVHAHGSCEPRLGNAKAGERFLLDTKIWSLKPGSHKKENVLKQIDTSLERLQVEQINILYLHHPDRSVPFEETCEALHMAYSQGKFKHWGLSNYAADEVSQIVDLCDRKGWRRPSVYQGQYNPIVRGAESDLFPILRKYGMGFYAYSPAAAGFFAGNHKNIKPGGRFDTSHFLGDLYTKQYVHEGVIAATERALAVAAGHGIGGHAAAVRWCAYSSALSSEHGDAIILGASSVTQLESNIDLVEQGRLPDDVVAALEAVYGEVKSAGAEIAYHW